MPENNGTNTETKQNTEDETNASKYYDGLVDFIADEWTEEGIIPEENTEEDTKEQIGAMLYLTSCYGLKDLVNNLFQIYEDIDEYDEIVEAEVEE